MSAEFAEMREGREKAESPCTTAAWALEVGMYMDNK